MRELREELARAERKLHPGPKAARTVKVSQGQQAVLQRLRGAQEAGEGAEEALLELRANDEQVDAQWDIDYAVWETVAPEEDDQQGENEEAERGEHPP